MKRSAIILCLLAALCAGALAAAHVRLMRTADAVSFRETALFGDIAAAEGLTLTARQSSGRQLYWDSVLPLDAPGLARTEFTALRKQKPLKSLYRPTGLDMHLGMGENSWDFGSGAEPSSLSRMLLSGSGDAGRAAWFELIRTVVEHTAAGETHTETLRVREHMEYLPLSFSLDLDGGVVLWHGRPYYAPENDESGLGELLHELFRIPVPEDATLTVQVTKDERGMVTELDTKSNLTGSVVTRSMLTEGKCWFILSPLGEEAFDFSELRYGCGLYCLPFGTELQRDIHENVVGLEVDAEALHTAFPFADDETPLDLTDGGDGTLLVSLRTQTGVDLVVLDAETEQVRQRLTLFAEPELDEEGWVLTPLGNALYTFCDTRVRYYERGADGRYTLLLDAPFGEKDELLDGYRHLDVYTPSAAAWDGERLAALIARTGGYRNYATGSLLLLVFDKAGLRYCGSLSSALMDGTAYDFEKQVVWGEHGMDDEDAALSLAFDGQWSAERTALHEGVSFVPGVRAASGPTVIGGAEEQTAIVVSTMDKRFVAQIAVIAALFLMEEGIRYLRRRKK